MSKSQESLYKKEIRNKKEKKRKEKEQKRLAKKDIDKKGTLEDMIAYVDENGMIASTPPVQSRKEKIKLEDIEIGIPRNDTSRESSYQRKGVVTFYNSAKGFGFIKDYETQEKIFMHVSNILEEIKEGSVVSYGTSGYKGRTATKVKLFKN